MWQNGTTDLVHDDDDDDDDDDVNDDDDGDKRTSNDEQKEMTRFSELFPIFKKLQLTTLQEKTNIVFW